MVYNLWVYSGGEGGGHHQRARVGETRLGERQPVLRPPPPPCSLQPAIGKAGGYHRWRRRSCRRRCSWRARTRHACVHACGLLPLPLLPLPLLLLARVYVHACVGVARIPSIPKVGGQQYKVGDDHETVDHLTEFVILILAAEVEAVELRRVVVVVVVIVVIVVVVVVVVCAAREWRRESPEESAHGERQCIARSSSRLRRFRAAAHHHHRRRRHRHRSRHPIRHRHRSGRRHRPDSSRRHSTSEVWSGRVVMRTWRASRVAASCSRS